MPEPSLAPTTNVARLLRMADDFEGFVAYWRDEYGATDMDLAAFIAIVYDSVWEAGAPAQEKPP